MRSVETDSCPPADRPDRPLPCGVAPAAPASVVEAVRAGGGTVVGPAEAEAVVWTDPLDAAGLAALLAGAPQVRWVQLPFAGVDRFARLLDADLVWTSAKGAYAEPVAEHALALGLAGLRALPSRARARTWGQAAGRRLHGAGVTILGGGTITEALLRFLAPFDVHATVVRRRPAPVAGAARVVAPGGMLEALPGAALIVLALALTDETRGVMGPDALDRMDGDAWLVNVARGEHVVTGALVDALAPAPSGAPRWTSLTPSRSRAAIPCGSWTTA